MKSNEGFGRKAAIPKELSEVFEKYFKPDRVYPKMSDVPFRELREKGFSVALLDLDNTLAEDHVHEPTEYTRRIIRDLEEAGFACCIVSNAKSTRSSDFAAMIPVECISYANKPSPSGIFRALERMCAKKRMRSCSVTGLYDIGLQGVPESILFRRTARKKGSLLCQTEKTAGENREASGEILGLCRTH
jgi:hypothetical protein